MLENEMNMGIKEDAGELLVYAYRQYVSEEKFVDAKDILTITKWDAGRINRAITYLEDLGAIKIQRYLGNIDGVHGFFMRGLTPSGIQTIENSKEFERNFGFIINLGLVQFSWGAKEK